MNDHSLDGRRPETVAIAAGRPGRAPGQPLNAPLVPAAVFHGPADPEYAREGHPTWAAFEEAVGALEGGQAVAFSSGMAAVTAVLDAVPVGGTVVAPADGYTGVRALLDDLAARGRLRWRPVAVDDTAGVLDACDGADLLWLESVTNPLLAIPDLAGVVPAARQRGIPVVVDNTFATPLRRRPLAAGADVVVHSVTKLLAGHADLLLGAAVTADTERCAALRRQRALQGAVPGVLESWLALRGVRTLAVRLDRAEENAGVLAARLASHAAVDVVRYPGFGTVVSFDVVGGAVAADAVCAGTRLVVMATSLGGVETTMERRGRHHGEEALPPGLIRLSVGCEHVEDLWADLAAALDAALGEPAPEPAPA